MSMGEQALPYIFEELQERGGQWHLALRAITGVSPVRQRLRGAHVSSESSGFSGAAHTATAAEHRSTWDRAGEHDAASFSFHSLIQRTILLESADRRERVRRSG